MSPTSIILCMAACFVGLVAALIVVNRFGSMSTRKLVVIAMMVAVYVVLNTCLLYTSGERGAGAE